MLVSKKVSNILKATIYSPSTWLFSQPSGPPRWPLLLFSTINIIIQKKHYNCHEPNFTHSFAKYHFFPALDAFSKLNWQHIDLHFNIVLEMNKNFKQKIIQARTKATLYFIM